MPCEAADPELADVVAVLAEGFTAADLAALLAQMAARAR